MFTYYYYRYWKYKTEFEKDNKVDLFAEYNMGATVDNIKKKGDLIREQIRHRIDKKKNCRNKIESIERGGGIILEDDEYHTIRAKVNRLSLLLICIFLSESGLNYFTSLIAIPLTDETRGLSFTLLRIAVAFVVTAIGIVCADQLFEEILPAKKYKAEATNDKMKFNIVRVILWLIGLIVIEYMIYHFGLARVEDIEGGIVNNDTAKSLIILSMIIPVVAGGIGWEISNYRDAYWNRKKFDLYTLQISKIDSDIEVLKERENNFFQKITTAYWAGYNRLKSFKEFYNNRKGQETADLTDSFKYAIDYDSYYSEALNRYDKHKEKRDAIDKIKISSGNAGVGNKIDKPNE